MEAWDIKTDDAREENAIFNFILFCEDSVSEPLYFEALAERYSNIKISPHKDSLSKNRNIRKALNYCIQEGIIDSVTEEAISEEVNIWCVFDRDKSIDPSQNTDSDIDFDLSIKAALTSGLNVAWSNDSFELWVLLHYKELIFDTELLGHRNAFYGQLTDIVKNLENQSEKLKRVTNNDQFSYKVNMKRPVHFREFLPELMTKTEVAILNSKKLYEASISLNDPSKKSPCTLIFKLVEKIEEVGEKINI